MLPWHDIHVVMLDMDGTLLDLNFDTHFWREHVPRRYAELRGLELDDAKNELYPRFREVEGTMDWYCLDYWSQTLELDVAALKQEVDHLIAIHPQVVDFLQWARNADKRLLLVTNAHAKSLALKMERTQLAHRFHAVICAHDLGLPKEQPEFWSKLAQIEPFDPEHTLLVDDSAAVLRSAHRFGIAHLRGVAQPDTQAPPLQPGDFETISSFGDIMPSTC